MYHANNAWPHLNAKNRPQLVGTSQRKFICLEKWRMSGWTDGVIPDRREPYRRVPLGRVHLDERRLDEVQ